MSPDLTSIAAGSLSFRLGDATITRIDETAFALAPDVLFPAWDPSHAPALAERLSSDSLDLGAHRAPLRTHLWVVQFDGHTIVIDTGIGNGKPRPFSALFDRLQTALPERFEAAGLRYDAVDFVLLTHLHVDHVGWNTRWRDGRWQPTFPNARYVFARRESDFFATAAGAARRMVFEDSVLPVIESGQAVQVPDEGTEIIPGLRFVPTPGHSAGHMAISLCRDGAEAMFSGDVMHNPLQVYRPDWNSTFCLNADDARASRHWLLNHAADRHATLFTAHFPETSAGTVLRRRDGFAWRYAPPQD